MVYVPWAFTSLKSLGLYFSTQGCALSAVTTDCFTFEDEAVVALAARALLSKKLAMSPNNEKSEKVGGTG